MEKQVSELVEAAWKYAKYGSQELNCVKALSQIKHLALNSDSVMLLSNDTQLLKKIESLSKHPRDAIKNAASAILTHWKTIRYHHHTLSPVKPLQNPKLGKLVIRIPTKNQPKVDSVHPMRNKIQQQVFEALCMAVNEAERERNCSLCRCDPMQVAMSVERELFQNWGVCGDGCRNKYRSLLFNLKDPKNLDFRRKILSGEIKPEGLPKLSAGEMASDGRKQENQMIKAKALKKCIVGSES